MVLRMPRPTRRKGTTKLQYRRTIPSDVKRILAGVPRAKWPRNWYDTHIVISLRTSDPAKAGAAQAKIAAEVEEQFAALRDGPKPLTRKQIAALSGELYRLFAEGLEDNPRLSPEQWRAIARNMEKAREGAYVHPLMIPTDDPKEKLKRSLEMRFGGLADFLLKDKKLVTTEQSREELIEQLSQDQPRAAHKLARNADGDYTKDTYAERFPSFEKSEKKGSAKQSLTALADAWADAATARGVRKATKTYPRIMRKFVEWLGHDDATRVTETDLIGWADARSKEGRDAKTINSSDLAGLKSMFKWGVKRKWMPTNPATSDTRIEGKRKKKLREKYFSDDEAGAILSAANRVSSGPRENFKTTAAKRWVPWLCAYSGARVMEMIQIRKLDVHRQDGRWFIRITPEAGGVKTDEFREVPIHAHVIALGFLDFVADAQDGPLFCELGSDGTTVGTADGVSNRVRTFVRQYVSDKNVQPNHAWRYTFKTRGVEAGIATLVLDAICGHAPRTKGDVTLKAKIKAIDMFPRYEVKGA